MSVNMRALLGARAFNQAFFKHPEGPRISELDTPVTLARTRLIPDSEIGFDRRVRIYGKAWAKITSLNQKRVLGRDAGTGITDHFIIREDRAYTIDARDMVFVGNDVYVIRDIGNATKTNPFVDLFATHAGTMEEHDLTLVPAGDEGEEIVPTPEQEEVSNEGTDFPVWM